jgi:hypothetical protein
VRHPQWWQANMFFVLQDMELEQVCSKYQKKISYSAASKYGANATK